MPKPIEYRRLLSGLVVDANFQVTTYNEKAVPLSGHFLLYFRPETS